MQPRHSNLKAVAAGKLAALQSSDEAAKGQALCAPRGHILLYPSKFCVRQSPCRLAWQEISELPWWP